jgi:hypothetical protein
MKDPSPKLLRISRVNGLSSRDQLNKKIKKYYCIHFTNADILNFIDPYHFNYCYIVILLKYIIIVMKTIYFLPTKFSNMFIYTKTMTIPN